MICPKAHKSCGDTHDGHHCWKNPGPTGPHGCVCWFTFPNPTSGELCGILPNLEQDTDA